jgi:hypothetical protein
MDDPGGTQLLVSRRKVLQTATYGIGAAALLFRPPLLDIPPDRLSRGIPDPVADPQAPQAPAATPKRPEQPEPGRAVHRARLSPAGQPRAVCKGVAGVLVVGIGDDAEPVSWLTQDGNRWVEHHLQSPAGGTPDVWGVAAHDGRFVAVGSITERDAAPAGTFPMSGEDNDHVTHATVRRVPTVWWTTDCTAWSGTVLGAVVDAHAQLVAVACDGRRLVAVGSLLDDDGVQGVGGVVLTSTDGYRWRTAAMPDGREVFAEGSFTAVAHVDDGWVAASSDMDGGAVWWSGDGGVWTVVPGSRQAFRGVTLQGIGARGRRWYAAGTSLIDAQPSFHVSRDGGRSWTPAPLDVQLVSGPDALVHDLSVISGDIVVVGTHAGAPVIEGGELDGGD